VNYGVRGLSRDFGPVRALGGVDLSVPAGSVVAVVGGDVAGKSTLLACLVGRLAPSAGQVHRPDRDQVGYMPSTSGTWRDLTVAENLEFVAGVFGLSGGTFARRRDELIDAAALGPATHRLSRDLSGGMRQKLGFAMAMLHRPELLVLDEPSTGVGPVSRGGLWRLIARAAAAGTAVAMATTYLDEAERASGITVLDRGRAIAAGSRQELMASCPGYVTEGDHPTDRERTWRRGRRVREWHPGSPPPTTAGTAVVPPGELDFEDVVIARLDDRRHPRDGGHR
jgi:ABC-2 type transport system ATP-binding protein